MTATANLTRLNDLLIDLRCSLLQYAQEAWPWTSVFDSGEVRREVETLAAQQRASVEELADFLDANGCSVDFGVYPDVYTSLHYVSLKYLIRQLVANEQALVQECIDVAREVAGEPDAAALLERIGQRERTILTGLQALQGV